MTVFVQEISFENSVATPVATCFNINMADGNFNQQKGNVVDGKASQDKKWFVIWSEFQKCIKCTPNQTWIN